MLNSHFIHQVEQLIGSSTGSRQAGRQSDRAKDGSVPQARMFIGLSYLGLSSKRGNGRMAKIASNSTRPLRNSFPRKLPAQRLANGRNVAQANHLGSEVVPRSCRPTHLLPKTPTNESIRDLLRGAVFVRRTREESVNLKPGDRQPRQNTRVQADFLPWCTAVPSWRT